MYVCVREREQEVYCVNRLCLHLCPFFRFPQLFKKPSNLSKIDASAILYAGLTAWSGLYITGHLGDLLGAISPVGGGAGKKVLVLGAAGGVGTLAVQMLLAEGVEVFATCSPDAMQMVNNLGVKYVLDYTDPAHVQNVASVGR